ncbi:MAG: aminotransferase class I/II-fold pyridoxal phosphate-dependent enzyme [Clostridia bacterium]|nr:aminotransferase class I/II-fold pyridoxal phosphate-dependent enzyme [Clostridia bacterium]
MNQNRIPIYESLNELKANRVVPFDVPGHKRGRGNALLTSFLGQKTMSVDVNSQLPIDNLCHPVSVIKEAQDLAAEAFGAAEAFFMVGGTTSAVQAMVFAATKKGDKILLPRNVHRSVLNALVLNGAVPVYIDPDLNFEFGISLGMKREAIKKAIEENKDAKAIFINNPTYYGICSDIEYIEKLAHENNMLLLVDEAHGTHFYFNSKLPKGAISVGADMASISMHKSGGSLTQSSILLVGKDKKGVSRINTDYLRQIINLTQTTSASYLLLSSLDISRHNLALYGESIFDKVIKMVEYSATEINAIGDYIAYTKELINRDSIFDFDQTKLSVNTLQIGLAGIEVYDILRDEYDIQIEFGDLGNILAYISVGDTMLNIERLIGALSEIRRKYKKSKIGMFTREYLTPIVSVSPQEAFYADKISIPLNETEGRICGEFLMTYPPGIPVLAPGEVVTPQIIDYIKYAKEKGCTVLGTEDMTLTNLSVLK